MKLRRGIIATSVCGKIRVCEIWYREDDSPDLQDVLAKGNIQLKICPDGEVIARVLSEKLDAEKEVMA